MGSPPLYPQYDDDGPAGSHPAPIDPARPNQAPSSTPTPTPSPPVPSRPAPAAAPPQPATPPPPGDDHLERTAHARAAGRASGVDDLLAVIGNLGDQLEAFKSMRAEHESEAARLDQLREELVRRESDLAGEAAVNAEKKAKLAAAHAAIKSEQDRLAQREAELAKRAEAISVREADAAAACERSRGIAESVEDERRRLAERERALEERESMARALQHAAQSQINETASASEWRAHAEAARAEAHARLAEAESARAELDASRNAFSEQLEASRRGEQASMAEWERLSEETAALRKRLAGAEREAESLRQTALTPDAVERLVDEAVSAARTKWESERPAAPPSPVAATEELDARLAEALQRAERAERALNDTLERSTTPGADGSGAPSDWQRQIRKRDQAIRALKEHLEAAEAKALERDQLFKLREEVLAERDRVKALAAVAQRKAARTHASVAVLVLTIALGIGAAGAWFGAGHFSPATYLAQATIVPDEREGALRASHVESWTLFHKSLVNDPVFIERAAERLAARGFADLGTPVALREAIRTRMSIADADGGGLIVSLRGLGSTSTERALDIFAGTLINQANAARDLRLDRTSSVIAASASAGDRPIEDARARLFGIIFGAISAVLLIAFALVSRWLANAPINAGDHVVDLNDSTMGFAGDAAALGVSPDATDRREASLSGE